MGAGGRGRRRRRGRWCRGLERGRRGGRRGDGICRRGGPVLERGRRRIGWCGMISRG